MNSLDGLHTLYISYNGMGEPLVRSQVLNYQEGLAARGVSVRLLTFEKAPPENEPAIRAELAGKGIAWEWRLYHGKKGMRGTVQDVLAGARFIRKHRGDIDFVHCRSFVPALMAYVAGLAGKTPFLYDVRGFWAHEKRYKGRIRNDAQFKLARFLEGRLYAAADAIVTLTRAGMDLLLRDYPRELAGTPGQVIPTCANVAPFLKERRALDPVAPVIVYSGSLGAGYLRDEVFRFYARLREHIPAATLLVLTRSNAAMVREGAAKAGLAPHDYAMRTLAPSDMADALLECDAALSFIKPDFSKIASCPTKMAEYLAAGLPVVANGGIGDVDAQLSDTGVGVVIDGFDNAMLDRAVDDLRKLLVDPDMIERGRAAAQSLFSLDLGIERYATLYTALSDRISR